MKELKMPEKVYNEEYGITITPYITIENCQTIATYVAFECDTPMDKKVARDCHVLKFCTDMENLDTYMYSDLYNSGLIDTVKNEVVNVGDIEMFEKELTSVEARFGKLIDSANTLILDIDKKLPKKLDVKGISKALGDVVGKLDIAQMNLEKVFTNADDNK